MDVSILIVCYQSKSLIGNCLRGVYAHTVGCDFEVLLVDCSNDGTADLVRREFPQVRIIENSENLGFGRGNNFLANHATGRYLLLLNPDTIISDDAIGELYRTAETFPAAGAVGGRTRLPNGNRDPGCQQFVPTIFRLVLAAAGGAKYLNGALAEDAQRAAEVETLCGAFMLVRTEAWKQLRGFDTSFFMYAEELDLCVRLRREGWKIVMTPRAEITHLVGSGQAQNPRRLELLTTGKMHFLRKFWSRPMACVGGVLLWLHGALRVLIGSCGGVLIGKKRAANLKTAYQGIVFRPHTWWRGFAISE